MCPNVPVPVTKRLAFSDAVPDAVQPYSWQVSSLALMFVLCASPITYCLKVIVEGWGSGCPLTWLQGGSEKTNLQRMEQLFDAHKYK